MTDLAAITNEQMPTSPARLPALAAPELSVAYLAQMKEILESLLGRRGSPWDRAVTMRDLQAGGLGAFLPGGSAASASPAIFNPGTGQVTTNGGATFDIDAALRESSAYKTLLRRIGSVEELADMPEQVRLQLDQAITALARERQADVRTVETMVQNQQLSVAWRLDEITASLNQAAAGARQYSAAYADQVRAVATRVEQVAAELEAGGGGVEVQEQLTAIADAVEGLKGQYSLKIQTNPTNGQPPIIAGIALSVEDPIAGPGTSSLVFLADNVGFFTDGGTLNPFSISGNRVTMTNVTMLSAIINGVLSAVSGTFGAVSIAADGSLQLGNRTYLSGTGMWFGFDGGVAKFAVGVAGGAEIKWDGTQLHIVNPTVSQPQFTVNPMQSEYTSLARIAGSYVGGKTATFSNAQGAVSGTWSISSSYGGGVVIDGANNGHSVLLKTANPMPTGEMDYYVTYTAHDAAGRAAFMDYIQTVDFT